MCSDFLHLPVPLGHLLLARMSYIGRGFEFTSWGNNQLYEHPTDVHSLPQMLSDWCLLIFWVDAVFTCPVCLGFFGSQPGFTTEMYLPQVGFIGFLTLHVTSCPPPFSQWCEQSQQLNEWQCILNCTFGMWQSGLPELMLVWYHGLHCYLQYTQLLFALGTDISLAVDSKALTMIALKQKYILLLLLHVVLLFCNLSWSILNLL